MIVNKNFAATASLNDSKPFLGGWTSTSHLHKIVKSLGDKQGDP